MKLSSLIFDEVFLEGGALRLLAGPHGAMTSPRHASESDRWQTPKQRKRQQESGFHISFASETEFGVPATGPMIPLVQSQTTICWSPTFTPFEEEFVTGTDWIHFVTVAGPSDETERAVRDWCWRDDRSAVLEREQPERFVRNLIIKHANGDLGASTEGQAAISADPLHGSVVRCRLEDDAWSLTGFALPILFPYAPDLPWEAIRDLRKDRNLVAYRKLLAEIEEEVLADVSGGGDVERAVHQAHAHKVRQANGKIEKLGVAVLKQVVSLGVGIGAGILTMPITGPVGPIAGAAPGAAVSLKTIGTLARRRHQRSWLAFDWRLDQERPGRT